MTGNRVIDILATGSFHRSFDKVPACQCPFRMILLPPEKMKDAIYKLKKSPPREMLLKGREMLCCSLEPPKRTMASTPHLGAESSPGDS